jgi:DNA-directed RNA polymerase specialized sigma24 family protein
MNHYDNAEKILNDHHTTIVAVCRRYSQDNILLTWEDLYQECCLRFYEKWERIRMMKIKNMQSFVMTLSKNHCLNVIRNIKLQTPKDLISVEQLMHKENLGQ